MIRVGLITVCALSLSAHVFGAEELILRSTAEINDFYSAPPRGNPGPFDVTGIVNYSDDGSFVLDDGKGRSWFGKSKTMPPIPKPGEIVRVRGYAKLDDGLEPWSFATNVEHIGKAELIPPRTVLLADIDDRALNLSEITTLGTVVDIRSDEVDPSIKFLILKDGSIRFTASIGTALLKHLGPLLDARVQVTGLFRRAIRGVRKYSGPYIQGGTICVLNPPPSDRFDAPDLECEFYLTPKDVATFDRRKIRGTVLATWAGSRLMLSADHHRILNVSLHDGEPLPACNTAVEIVGYPQTDRYRIHLENATWRSVDGDPQDSDQSHVMSAKDLLRNAQGELRIATEMHGALITVNGLVRNIQTVSPSHEPPTVSRIILESERLAFPVDCSTHPEIAESIGVGDIIEVTGRCLIETDAVTSLTPFTQARGFSVIPYKKSEIRILSRPPWWTPGKLLVVIGILFAVILALFVRNRLQKRFGKLKVAERTRLAVELHDTLAQNLTGVSMELEAANDLRGDAPQEMLVHVDIAAKALKSCRGELRNCLWDLRSQALEEPDMTRAVRRTLQPLVTAAHLGVRFNVPRTDLSDNTAHALLRVIRELVSNAIHHGKATSVKVAGTLDNGTILCSVADNGCGFDPDTAPGILQGHFGLQGIRERIQQLGGTLKIESALNRGTRAVITIRKPLS